MVEYSVSLWSADLTNLGKAVRDLEKYADYFHFDVADGHFVPTLLFFPDLIKSLRPLTSVPFDVHLIVSDPDRFIVPFIDAGANIISVYPETCQNLPQTLYKIKNNKVKASVALSPGTPVQVLEPVIDIIDMIVVMGTKNGIKGCSLLSSTYKRIADVKKMVSTLRKNSDIKIEVDGGIRRETVPHLIEAGADILVPGSLVFKNDYSQIFAWLRQLG